MKLITIANPKGGCGKTTTAVYLSLLLQEKGLKTLLIDLDPQQHASLALGNQPVEKNLDLQALKAQEGEYNFVICDTPPALNELTAKAVRAADAVIAPVEMGIFALRGAGHLQNFVQEIRKKDPPTVWGLATLYDPRTRFAKNFLAELAQFFGHHLLSSLIYSTVKIREAASAGKPMMSQGGSAHGYKDYSALAEEVLHKIVPAIKTRETSAVEEEITIPSDGVTLDEFDQLMQDI